MTFSERKRAYIKDANLIPEPIKYDEGGEEYFEVKQVTARHLNKDKIDK
jgi:hypothetical protein